MNAAVLRPAFAHKLPAQTFTAWRIPTADGPECAHALPLEIGHPETAGWALANAMGNFPNHKDHLAIVQDHAGLRSKTLRIYAIKRESQRKFRRDPVTGETRCEQREYPVLLIELPVAEFDPCEPFRVTRETTHAEIVGFDPALVEG